MTTYNTGNPLGSTDPRDLYDNAENLDVAVNSEEHQWVDRFGRPRLPLMEQERQFVSDQERREGEFQADQSSRETVFADFLQASGYQDLGEYAPGIEIAAHNQYVTFGGQPYLLKPSVPVPYTTSGEWTGGDFKLIGDDSLRQDLANPDKGAAMVARGVVAVDSIADLPALPEGQRKEDLRYLVKGFYAGSDVGGGMFYWDAYRDKADHNGGTVIDPARVAAWDGTQGDLSTLFAAAVSGSGCFVRINYDRVTPEMCGAIYGYSEHNHVSLEHLAKQDWPVDWGNKEYVVENSIGDVTKNSAIDWVSSGCSITLNPQADEQPYLFRLSIPGARDHVIKGRLKFNANLNAQSGFWLENMSTSGYATIDAEGLEVSNIRRTGNVTPLGGDGIRIRGAFNSVILRSPKVVNVRMAAGSGISGIQGISGISVLANRPESTHPSYVRIINPWIEGVESEDLDYTWDQDGIRIFGAGDWGADNFSYFHIEGGRLIDCLGRFVKSQAGGGKISGVVFEVNKSLNNSRTLGVDGQYGFVDMEDCQFVIGENALPCNVASGRGSEDYKNATLNVSNIKYFNGNLAGDSTHFVGTYGQGPIQSINIRDIYIKGKVAYICDIATKSRDTVVNLDNIDVEEITGVAAVIFKNGGDYTDPLGLPTGRLRCGNLFHRTENNVHLMACGVEMVSMNAVSHVTGILHNINFKSSANRGSNPRLGDANAMFPGLAAYSPNTSVLASNAYGSVERFRRADLPGNATAELEIDYANFYGNQYVEIFTGRGLCCAVSFNLADGNVHEIWQGGRYSASIGPGDPVGSRYHIYSDTPGVLKVENRVAQADSISYKVITAS